MAIQIITSYRFIPGKESKITTYGSPDEQTVAIHNSSSTSVSLTFTTESTSVVKQLIKNLAEVYQTLAYTTPEIIQEECNQEF